jgi:hypothetical protein
MMLMSKGLYSEPAGSFFLPSIFESQPIGSVADEMFGDLET